MATLPAISTPELPREYFIPTGVPTTTTTVTVGPTAAYTYNAVTYGSNGAALQAAINASQPGWKIVVCTKHPVTNARQYYDGMFALKVHSPETTTWSVLIGDKADDGTLVPFGTRVDPVDIDLMPTIRANSENSTALYTDWNSPTNTIGGHYWYICGIHFTNTDVALNTPMIGIGCRQARYAWLSTQAAHHVVLDRIWAEGRGGAYQCARLVVIAGHHNAVVNSYVRGAATSNISNGDAQGIHIIKGIGRHDGGGSGANSPVHIENNFIEAESESMNIGGDVVNFDDLVSPEVCDVTIRGNFITKDLRRHPCAGSTYFPGVTYTSTLGTACKNLMEFKHGNRILVEGNHFRNSWGSYDNQNYAIVLNVRPHDSNTYHADRNCDDSFGGCLPYYPDPGKKNYPSIRDVTVQRNVFEGMRGWVQLGGSQFGGDTVNTAPTVGVGTRWLFQHNLVLDMRYEPWNRNAHIATGDAGTTCGSMISGQSHIGNLILWCCSSPPSTWKGGPDYVTFDHNTIYQSGTNSSETYWGVLIQPSDGSIQNHPPNGFRFTDNIVGCGNRGFYYFNPGGVNRLDGIFTTGGYTLQGNVFVEYGGTLNNPPNQMGQATMVKDSGNAVANGNYFVKHWSQVGMLTAPPDGDLMYYSSNLTLDPYNVNTLATADTDYDSGVSVLGKATDGQNPGADMSAISTYAGGVGTYALDLTMLTRGQMVSIPTSTPATGTREFARVRIG